MQITIQEILALGWRTRLAPSPGQKIVYEDITADSRKVAPKSVFFAFDGIKSAGKMYIPQAAQNGACAIFTDAKYESQLADMETAFQIPFFYAEAFKEIAPKTMASLYHAPASKMGCIGITGTNGKTTIAWALYSALKRLGRKPSYVGTIGIELPTESSPNPLTTPPLDEMHRLTYVARLQGGDYFISETSSHGLIQGRLDGIDWDIAIFTNLTEDHRDYHKTMEDYYLAKRILFEKWAESARGDLHKAVDGASLKKLTRTAIINTDDEYGLTLFNWLKTSYPELPVVGIGKNSAAAAKIVSINPAWSGYEACLEFSNATYRLKSKCIGEFNIYNLAMTFAALLALGFDPAQALAALEDFTGAPGRMEMYHKPNGGMILVDYAHTPDALKKALQTLRQLQPTRLVVVFGCGGDRDRGKRSQMGKISEDHADFTFITNDNPRSEDPVEIVAQIASGRSGKNYKIIYDRRRAIEEAVAGLEADEVLLVAGKGHEDYQVLSGATIHFSDGEVVKEALCKT